jgi:hypothetical protein
VCAPAIATAAAPLVARLVQQMGARFTVRPDPSFPRERLEVGPA